MTKEEMIELVKLSGCCCLLFTFFCPLIDFAYCLLLALLLACFLVLVVIAVVAAVDLPTNTIERRSKCRL
jgi:hypothetical protein